MTSILLSYARGDDGEPFTRATSFVARLQRDLTAAGFDVWFDRVSMPSRSLTFHQEIRDAVATRDRLVLVVGPKAAESLYVRQEWQFAYFEAEKIVTPILRSGDYGHVPDELKLLHCEDFREERQYDFHLKNLIRQIAEPAPALGKLIAVPSLPAHFLSRTERLMVLRDALRADLERPVVITGAAARVGVHGMGGIGKSVLAATLARDRKIREAFPDGIVWVGLGSLPAVADLQRRVHKDLGGDGAFQTEHEGRIKLRDILKDKGVLLIIDDVWHRPDVDWFDVLGPRCRAMITTRDAGLLTSLGGVHHQVELLNDAEALDLLAQAAGVERDKLPSEAADLIAECGRLPLAVALCGGLIRAGFAWAKVLEQLRASRIDRIKDPHAAKVEHENIWNAIDVSVKFLSPAEQARFLELAVFPPDEATPIAALGTLWSHTAGFDDWDTDALVIKLSQRSLLELTTSAVGKAISLHDLVYDYVHRAAGDEKGLHQRLLEAYRRKCPDGWHLDPPNDGYFLTHLRHHLIAASRAGELADLLHELRWLEAKNEAELTFDLTVDFDATMKALPEMAGRMRNLRLLDEAMRRDIQFIARHAKDYPQALFQCLWNSCWWYDTPQAASHYDFSKHTGGELLPWELPSQWRLSTLLECWLSQKEQATPGFCWFRSLRPPRIRLKAGQKAVLRGHGGPVMSVSYSCANGHERIASGAIDGTVRIWDADSGAELMKLTNDPGWIAAYSPDGKYLATGGPGGNRRIHIRDAESGLELRCVSCDGDLGWKMKWSPDGRRIVSASSDKKARVFDTYTGMELVCLSGHEGDVTDVDFSPDGKRIVSASSDKTLRVWDAYTGVELLCVIGHIGELKNPKFSPDGKRIACNSDKSLQIWDANSGNELLCLDGPVDGVQRLIYSPDGRHIATCSTDLTVRVWDASSGVERLRFTGHDYEVYDIAFSHDGRRIFSASRDRTVRVWNVDSEHLWLQLSESQDRLASVSCSPNGRRILSTSFMGPITCWDADNGVVLFRATEKAGLFRQATIAYSPNSRWVAVPIRDNTVCVVDTDRGNEAFRLVGHQGIITSLTYSPDGERIVTGSSDKTVRIWDATTGAHLFMLGAHSDSVDSVAYSPDSHRIASASSDGTVRIWNADSGDELLRLLLPKNSHDASRRTSRRWNSLNSHDASHRTSRRWNSLRGYLAADIEDTTFEKVAFSLDGCYVASRGMKKSRGVSFNISEWIEERILVWDVNTGSLLKDRDGSRWENLKVDQTRPLRIIEFGGVDICISPLSNSAPVAWFPHLIEQVDSDAFCRIWAGKLAGTLFIFRLEGDYSQLYQSASDG